MHNKQRENGVDGIIQTLCLCAILFFFCGCSSSVKTSDGRPMPPAPRAGPATPKDSKTNAMAMLVGFKPMDTNGNNYPDLITVQAFLYAKPHPTSMYEEGVFVFELFSAGGSSRKESALATWRFEPADAENAKVYSRLFERGYAFRLSLLDVGSDVLPVSTGNLVGRFEPADGRPAIPCIGVRTLQIGRSGATTALAH